MATGGGDPLQGAGRKAERARRPVLVVLLALVLSLLTGGRGAASERRLERETGSAAISAPVDNARSATRTARKPWETRGHPRKAKRPAKSARIARKPWETRGHPRKAPTPRSGSANGPRAP